MTLVQRIKCALFTRYEVQSERAKRAGLWNAYSAGVKIGRVWAATAHRNEIDQAHSVVKLACADRDEAVASMVMADAAVLVLRKAYAVCGTEVGTLRKELKDSREAQCQCADDARGNH